VSTKEDHPFDPGLQNERTAMSWDRTALALFAASLLVARLNASETGIVGWLLALAGLVITVWIMVTARARYRTAHRALHAAAPLPDGRLAAAVAALTAIAASIEVVAVLR